MDIDIPEEQIIVALDEKKFKRVYDNILGNFFRHNDPDGPFSAGLPNRTEKSGSCSPTMERGYQKDIRETIFDPFVVGEKARTHGGSGLGLSIARKITEGHGGKICLRFPPESGFSTEFVIELTADKRI